MGQTSSQKLQHFIRSELFRKMNIIVLTSDVSTLNGIIANLKFMHISTLLRSFKPSVNTANFRNGPGVLSIGQPKDHFRARK